jgi:hypothetical protein
LEENMIKTHLAVMEELKDYSSPKAKLTRLLKTGELIQIRRGLFVDNPAVSRNVLASAVYGPSYISFEYALSSAGLIPERVKAVTSACFHKNRNKTFRTPLGEFRYFYLPDSVYPYGIQLKEDDDMSYLIASGEKALCDAVYKVPAVVTISEIEYLLLEDWRMEREDLLKLDQTFIKWIAPMYRRKSLLALAKWFEKEGAQ